MINFIDITNEISFYQDNLIEFLDNLSTEKRFFNITLDRILKSRLVIIAVDNTVTLSKSKSFKKRPFKIIGVAGIEKKFGIARDYVILNKNYQKLGIGTKLRSFLFSESKKIYNLIMPLISEQNDVAISWYIKSGFKMIGSKDHLIYFAYPLNSKGQLQYFVLKLIFPFIKIIDFFRH